MPRKKRANKHVGRQAPPDQILLLATIRLEEGPEVPCDLGATMPGWLLWEDYRPVDERQSQAPTALDRHIQRLRQEQALVAPQLSLRMHLCPEHVLFALRQLFPKAGGLEAEWLLSLIGQERPKCLAVVSRLPAEQTAICLVTANDPGQMLHEIYSFPIS